MYSGPPDFVDTALVCPLYPAPPSSAKLNISSADDPMCPGNVATYKCIAGGINAFKVIFGINYFNLVKILISKTTNRVELAYKTVYFFLYVQITTVQNN